MNSFIKTAKRLGTSAILLLGTCWTASAQFSTGGSAVTSPVCQTHLTPTNTAGTPVTYSITLPAGQTFSPWTTRGDISISNPTNVGSVYSITVTSTGFGRGRLAFNTVIGSCGPTPTYLVINKTFPAPLPAIVGPAGCVQAGKTYAFSVSPIISTTSQIDQQIGIDSYNWTIPVGTVVYSGDKSAATVTMPNPLTAGFNVTVQTGACNGGQIRTIPVTIQPLVPSLLLTSGTATCKTDLLPFVLSYSAQANINYTWSIPTGWSIAYSGTPAASNGFVVQYAADGPQSVTITPNAATFGDVAVEASYPTGGGCTAVSNVFKVTRQLTSANTITSSVPGCLTNGAGNNVTFTVNPGFPSNTVYKWTLPAGWAAPTGTGNSITVPVGTGSGTVSVSVMNGATPCAGPGATLAVTVNGNNGCAHQIVTGCGTYQDTRLSPVPLTAGCITNFYVWTITSPSGALLASSSTVPASPNPNGATFLFSTYYPTTSILTGSTIRCVATNAATCLRVETVLVTTSDYIPRITCRGINPDPGNGGSSVGPLTEQTVVYPNPTGSQLQVNLPVKKAGTSRLTLTDALGRVVLTTTSEEPRATLDVRALPQGTYTLRTTVPGGKEQAQTVVIER